MAYVFSLTIMDAVRATGISRTAIHDLIAAQKLDARKCGNRTLILGDSLRNYITGLPAAVNHTGQPKAAA